MRPLLSIIILQYNNHKFFGSLFESIAKQATIPLEIILADDCSNDGFDETKYMELVEKNGNKNVISFIIQRNEKNVGTVKNLNLALKKVNGEYVKIIAVDDSFPLDGCVFNEQCSFLEKNPNKSFVLGNIMVCDAELKPIFVKSLKDLGNKSDLFNPDHLFKKIIRGHTDLFAIQSICFRRNFFDGFIFDERLRLIEDLPFIVWTFSNKIEFGYIDKVSVLYRSDAGISTTSETFSLRRMPYYKDLQLFYKYILRPHKKNIGRVYYWTRKNVIDFRIKYTAKKSFILLIRYFVPLILYFFYCPKNAKKHYSNRG